MQVKQYKPISPMIQAFHKTDAQVRCIVGAVGTGKTTAALWEIAFNRPRYIYMTWGIAHTRWVVVRKTYEQLMDTDFQEAMDWFVQGHWVPSKKRLTITWPASKNCPAALVVDLIFHSCNTPEEEGKFRSMNLTGCWIDESNQLDVVTKNIIKGRLGRFPKVSETPCHFTPRYMVETSNPFAADHPMYSTFDWMGPKCIKPGLPEYRCTVCDKMFASDVDAPCPDCGSRAERTGNVDWRTGIYDTDVLDHKPPRGPVPMGTPTKDHIGFWQEPGENAENLRPGYWDAIRNDYKEAPEMSRILIEGKAGMQPKGKPVYRNFVQEIHVASGQLQWAQERDPYSGDIKGVALAAGWDSTGNWPAVVLAQRSGPGQYQVLREFFDDRMGIVDLGRWFASIINQEYPGANIAHYGDPAGASRFSNRQGGLTSAVDLLREECGITIVPSFQDLEARINTVDGILLRRDGLLIDQRCTMLINGFTAAYVREENVRAGLREFKEDPIKNRYSHVHDALQYLLVALENLDRIGQRRDRDEQKRKRDAAMMGMSLMGSSKSYAGFDPRRD